MARADVLDAPNTGAVTPAAAPMAANTGAVNGADLWAAIADEIGRLNEEGRSPQVLASHLARDTRPEFEAWFEAGLVLCRASERLAQIAQRLA